ncbi:hypothetical protein [Streptomyces sp. SYSU K217416]
MRSTLLTFRAASAAVVLLCLPATDAYADEEKRATLTVVPSTVEPGGEIELRVNGCERRTGTATAAVFVDDADLAAVGGQGSPLFGEAMIRPKAPAGWHTIQVHCDGREDVATGRVRVVEEGGPRHETTDDPTREPTLEPTHKQPYRPTVKPTHTQEPTRHESPVSPVRAGGGGTSPQAAHASHTAEDDGPGTRQTVVGVLLAAAATVAVAGRAVRRRRRSD